jgi:hypothetical protein
VLRVRLPSIIHLDLTIASNETEADKYCRFGAVLEEFEVRDALEAVFSEKAMPTLDSTFVAQQQQIPAMA